MRHIADVVDGDVIADVTGNNFAIGDADGQFKIVMFEHGILHTTKPHETIKFGVLNLIRIKLLCNQNIVPIIGCVVVFDQSFELMGIELAPRCGRSLMLRISQIVFIFAIREKLARNKIFADFSRRLQMYAMHKSVPFCY